MAPKNVAPQRDTGADDIGFRLARSLAGVLDSINAQLRGLARGEVSHV